MRKDQERSGGSGGSVRPGEIRRIRRDLERSGEVRIRKKTRTKDEEEL